MILLLLSLAIAACIIYSLFINKIRGLPPGPPPLPLLGNILHFEKDMSKVLFGFKQRYGKVFTVWMPRPTVVIADNKLLFDLIVTDGEKFSDRMIGSSDKYGLVFNDNSIWREQRRFALHTLRNVGFNSANIQDSTIQYANEIVARWKEEGAGKKPLDLTTGITVGVSNTVWHQIFGRTLPFEDPLLPKVKGVMTEIIDLASHPIMFMIGLFPPIGYLLKFVDSPVRKLEDRMIQFKKMLDNELDLVKKNIHDDEEPKCYADAFIAEMTRRKEKGEDMGSFCHEQLVSACGDLWIAGMETTVTTLRYAFHYLINNVIIQEKCQREIDEQVGNRTIQMADQKNLHYCNAVMQEVLRISSINMSFPRKTSAPVTIDGYDIPVGTGVLAEFSLVHSDPNEFERPDYFCPERHLNDRGEFVKDPRLMPFSMGKRACLGEGLARMQLFLYFTSFLQHLSFSPVSKIPPELKEAIGIARYPEPYEVLVESRK